MSYLTLVYGGGIIVSSAAAFGATYLGNMISPIETPKPAETPPKPAETPPKPAETPPKPKDELTPETIGKLFKPENLKKGKIIVDLIKTPSSEWSKFVEDQPEDPSFMKRLKAKLAANDFTAGEHMVGCDSAKCIRIVNLATSKVFDMMFVSMKSKNVKNLGDQTREALAILQSKKP
jgi:hypothetical protein